MHIAVVGCAHGEIEQIITSIQSKNESIDLLICCGDFQAVRNEHDLCNMACPLKYRKLNTFYKYYSGELVAPFPIICIGGNHEASNYLYELYHGGWLAPNMYYLGAAGSVIFGGLRICGISGIFKQHDFDKGHYETLPMSQNHMYSVYHVRRYNIWRLSHLHGNNIDIFLSHDWPSCIWKYGDWHKLAKIKPHFVDDMKHDKLGNPALNHLLFQLQPKQWFSGHLHVHFDAVVQHQDTQNVTQFVATDKFDSGNRRRRSVKVIQVAQPANAQRDENTGFYKFEYDPVWLAVMKSTNEFMPVEFRPLPLPTKHGNEMFSFKRWDFRPSKEEIDDVANSFDGELRIPNHFCQTALVCNNPGDPNLKHKGRAPEFVSNPQTKFLMEKLGIRDKLSEKYTKTVVSEQEESKMDLEDPNEIDIEDDTDIVCAQSSPNDIVHALSDSNEMDMDEVHVHDPNEIFLDDDAIADIVAPPEAQSSAVDTSDPNEIAIDEPQAKEQKL